MDRLDELVVFLAILETASLSGAGRKLRRSPPAVTRTLAALEERVGTRLVERTTRRLAATEAGLRLAELARRVLADYEDAVREDADAPLRGKLRVTAPQVFGRRHVAPVVLSFMDKYPSMQVELMLGDRNLDLIEEGLDLAVRIGRLADAGIVARKVGEVKRLLVASPDYIAKRGAPQTPDDLAAHDTIHNTGVPAPPEWRFRHAGSDHTVRVTPRLTVNDVDAMLFAVRSGRGLGRPLSYQAADDIAKGTLVRLMPDWENDAVPVSLVVSSARHMAPKLRAFMDHAVECLSKLEVLQPLPK
ncbi:LysR family transcriptional regulator [Undibacterium terreum]|uniref:Transcriptional regulator n=1 Tax=Undibacterium terreum TaxID=1224302 RepID=A0A916UZZ9_9BURK|nr:LysR family transcriptional regulator [Undibacterium terreum]GGC96161.1 transcriptional regulator [Undibacterium terreum]